MAENATGWLTFDCYGTLVDWRKGMTDALRSVAGGRAEDLLDAYHRHEASQQATTPFPSYRQVLHDALSLAARDLGLDLGDGQLHVLGDTMAAWPAFDETASTLNQLRSDGWRLGILSNVDNEVVRRTVDELGAPIDLVITAEDVRSYKPAAGHFETFRRHLESPDVPWLHVACSLYHDVEPANRIGTPAVFVNREGVSTAGIDVVAVLPDLHELPVVVRPYLQVQQRP
jgi:2-haloacid dehalogenase